MRLGKKDRFNKDNQVYFRYGRLSNRKMLECYGMTIEGNKYDHLWVRIDGLKYLSAYPDMLERMQSRRLTLKYKFKVKRREFSMELVLFYRMVNWSRMRHTIEELFTPVDLNREVKALHGYEDLLKEIVAQEDKESALEEELKKPGLGYHGYFAVVYRL